MTVMTMPDVRTIPIDRIIIDRKLSPRSTTDRATMKRYAHEMEHSEFPPVIVSDLGNGRFLMVDGHRRIGARKLRGETTIAAEVRVIPVARLFEEAVIPNLRHGQRLTDQEILAAARRLVVESGRDLDEVARIVGLPRIQLERELRRGRGLMLHARKPERHRPVHRAPVAPAADETQVSDDTSPIPASVNGVPEPEPPTTEVPESAAPYIAMAHQLTEALDTNRLDATHPAVTVAMQMLVRAWYRRIRK